MARLGLSGAATALGPGAKIWLNRFGTLLGLAGIIFVALRLRTYAGEIDFGRITGAGYLALAALAAAYGASNLLLAAGWWHLLRFLGVDALRGWALRAYAVSQLAKYVPGNIFQFAGRQAIGVAAGIGNRPLAKSTGLELALLIGGGLLFAPLPVPVLAGWHGSGTTIGALAVFAVLVAAALLLSARLGGPRLASAARRYLTFLLVSGAIFVGTYWVAGGALSPVDVPAIAGAYVLAWLAGLVTPGAPAGIGVREAVLLYLLGGVGTPPVILLAVVLGRAVTVLGDLGFYLAGNTVTARRRD